MKILYRNIILFVFSLNFLCVTAQNQELIDNDWFVHMVKDGEIFETTLNEDTELRFKIEFLSDKMVLTGCCGGKFELYINYIGESAIQFLNFTEIDVYNCTESYTMDFYEAIKNVFSSLVGEIIDYSIINYPLLPSGIKYITLSHPTNNKFVDVSNTPNEVEDSALSPYWSIEPPLHVWSLTTVIYQGEIYELPYGAAITVADVFEGTFSISLCGEIFVAINFSWFLDSTELNGPCYISCGIIENSYGSCEPVAGYDEIYLQNFKQSTFDFLTDYKEEILLFTVTLGSARKLVIKKGYPSGDKLVFYSNENYVSIDENPFDVNITVFPNPIVDELFVYNPVGDVLNVSLYTVSGQLLWQNELEHTNNMVSTKDISAGTYFLVVKDASGQKTVKKVVKK